MTVKKNHSFHLVDIRPWPILGSFSALILTSGIVKWFHIYNIRLFLNGLLVTTIVCIQWWRDVSRERTYQGIHTFKVVSGIKWGIILFIVSEVFFFLSFFWGFLYSSLSPRIEIGILWPPIGVYPFNPFQIPLLNTIILLSSGITITWSHHSIIENNLSQARKRLLLTVVLGIYFTSLQALEYIEANFTISDAVYGSAFFLSTGFHGLHVIIGTRFLLVCYLRIINANFSRIHHFGFEAAAWYWHFVDVVWLFLYISVYWWGSYVLIIKSKFNFQLKSPLKGEHNNFFSYTKNDFISNFNCDQYNNFIEKRNTTRERVSFWMWIWSKVVCTSSILITLFFSGSNFPNLWCRNYNPNAHTINVNKIKSRDMNNFINYVYYYLNYRDSSWVKRRITRLN